MTDSDTHRDPLSAEMIAWMKTSPVLHLSLGSKELFHSNFIAFLCERHPDRMAEALGDLLASPDAEAGGLTVARERNHFDLELALGTRRVVVEVKVKSLPREDQLREYGENANRVTKTTKAADALWVWSLWRPPFFGNRTSWAWPSKDSPPIDPQPPEWRYFDLEDVVRRIHAHVRGVADDYLGGLLDDWLALVEWLSDVRRTVVSGDSKGFWARVRELEGLKKVRVHDLFEKALYDLLSQAIEDRIAPLAAARSIQVDPGGMTRSQGVCSVYRDLAGSARDGKQWVRIGVQIQGRQFRLFSNTASTDGERAKEIATNLHRKGRWFDVEELVKKYGEFLEPANMTKPFGTFAPSFFHRYALLKEDATLQDIARVAAEVVASTDTSGAGWLP